ncbi:MAG: agmatine deiminase family protein [Bacteroidales bacterium]|nr:agmatine deiminase family protein [Candidatus Scybalousia scybalohippi]
MTNAYTPKQLGFSFPAEWHKHKATWLSYPHNENSWPGKIETIYPSYNLFIKELAQVEQVHINILDENQKIWAENELKKISCNMSNVFFHSFKTNDAWIRDHGPAFVLNGKEKAIVNWNYNAWGGKYPAELDNLIPEQIADYLDLSSFEPGIVMEGGSVDFNGVGDLLTTEACLLNENRNPELSREEIEDKLREFYGVENILWLKDGIDGDDTDGHVDDLTRFVNEDTVVTMVEPDKNDDNYEVLKENLDLLSKMRLNNGKQVNVVELVMPARVEYEEQRLPASYANFYIANDKVIMPLYKCDQDEKAFLTLESVFKDRKIVGIDSTDIIWGLGSFHCLSQQEPEI